MYRGTEVQRYIGTKIERYRVLRRKYLGRPTKPNPVLAAAEG